MQDYGMFHSRETTNLKKCRPMLWDNERVKAVVIKSNFKANIYKLLFLVWRFHGYFRCSQNVKPRFYNISVSIRLTERFSVFCGAKLNINLFQVYQLSVHHACNHSMHFRLRRRPQRNMTRAFCSRNIYHHSIVNSVVHIPGVAYGWGKI